MNRERPALPPGLVLLIAVLAMSWSGPLIKFATAPAQVVSAWRLVFAVGFIAFMLIVRRTPASAARMSRPEWLLAAGAGVMLALHFWSWIASLQYTTVMSSVALVSMQPIFVAAFSGALLHERATRAQWLGIILACVGAVIVGIGDARGAGGTLSRAALFGDALALLGCLLGSGYYVIGRRLRQKLDLWVYTFIVYGMAALVLIVVIMLDPATRLTGYPRTDWWVFLAIAAGPMLLGHTGINYALRYVRAYVANIAILGEPVGATIIAWWLLHESPSPLTLAGAAFIGVGILLGARGRPETTQS
jgi:drug/metabolite transporter (DMT)-like permease